MNSPVCPHPMEALHIKTISPEETRQLGEMIGRNIGQNTTFFLSGDLGAGKTVFVQGLARGLAVPPDYYITSPTYTLINEYPGRLNLFHADLYRISDAAELMDIGFEEFEDINGVMVIEWADRLRPGDFSCDISIVIHIIDDRIRDFTLFFYGRKNTDLLNFLKKIFEKEKR